MRSENATKCTNYVQLITKIFFYKDLGEAREKRLGFQIESKQAYRVISRWLVFQGTIAIGAQPSRGSDTDGQRKSFKAAAKITNEYLFILFL
jgi:hypothetical protein